MMIHFCNPLTPDAPVIYHESLDSTMLEARRMTDSSGGSGCAPVISGTVVRAGHQSAGRGRITDRRWEAAPDDGLLFTVLFSKADLSVRMGGRRFTLLPLLCGLAVSTAVESYLDEAKIDIKARIKWPNDVIADGRKLCGILCEASGEWVYAGIGINLNQTEFTEGLRRPACSLRMLTGQLSDGDMLLKLVLQQLNAVLASSDWQSDIEQRLFLVNEKVGFHPGVPKEFSPETGERELVRGRLKGIDAAGALLLETPDGIVSFISGELLA